VWAIKIKVSEVGMLFPNTSFAEALPRTAETRLIFRVAAKLSAF
jgi:hypothetical protein